MKGNAMTNIKVQTQEDILHTLETERKKAMAAMDEFNKVMKSLIEEMGGREFM